MFPLRPTQDKLTQFVDLASITNVSTLALDSKLHGYYIHGRSPHGFADVDMKALITNLKKVGVVSSGSVTTWPVFHNCCNVAVHHSHGCVRLLLSCRKSQTLPDNVGWSMAPTDRHLRSLCRPSCVSTGTRCSSTYSRRTRTFLQMRRQAPARGRSQQARRPRLIFSSAHLSTTHSGIWTTSSR